MRAVHEIVKQDGNAVAIAFIQWGNREDGFEYECICPWCAKTVGRLRDLPKGHMPTIFSRIRAEVARHITQGCIHVGGKFQVYVTTKPLNTERLVDIPEA